MSVLRFHLSQAHQRTSLPCKPFSSTPALPPAVHIPSEKAFSGMLFPMLYELLQEPLMVPSHQLQPSPAIKILTGLSGPTVTKYTQIPTERFNGLQSKSYQRGRSKHPGQTHRSCARNSSSHDPSYSCRPPNKLRHVEPSGYIQK